MTEEKEKKLIMAAIAVMFGLPFIINILKINFFTASIIGFIGVVWLFDYKKRVDVK